MSEIKKNAARIGDMHTCPLPAHIGGPLTPMAEPAKVFINKLPAATLGTSSLCTGVGLIDTIIQGSSRVFIEGKPAARIGDLSAHGGVITTGSGNVFFG